MSKSLAAMQPPESNSSVAAIAGSAVTDSAAGLTVEHGLYGILLLVAFFLRFFRLGSAALLAPVEAGQAWVAWASVTGYEQALPAVAHSPLLYAAQRFFFWLTDGGGDGWARLLPALAGGLLVLVPWLLRDILGKPVSLSLALLLALDPWLLTFSRTGDGAILSVCLALVLLAGLAQGDRLSTVGRRWLAVAAGLFLISGPLAWLLLPVLIGGAVLFGGLSLWPEEQTERARLLTIAGITVLAGATSFLSDWDGIGVISSSLTVAVAALTGNADYPLAWPVMRLIADQPLAVILGLAGIASFWLADRPNAVSQKNSGDGDSSPAPNRSRNAALPDSWRLLLTGWLLWGLLLLLLPGRSPMALLVLGLPLVICAAGLLPRLLAYATRQVHWQDGVLIAGAMSVLLVTSLIWTSHYSSEWSSPDFDRLTFFFYALLPVLGIFFVWWAGWRTSSQMYTLLGLGFLLLLTLGSGWSLNQPGLITQGNALFADTARPGLGGLVADVARLSSMRAMDPQEAPVLLAVEPKLQPLLGWNLRSMHNLRFVDGIDPAQVAEPSVLVIAGGAAGAFLPGGYVGSQYQVAARWLPTDLTGSGPVVRWILLRESKIEPPIKSVVLWAREE
ncbi:MAG: hypothetical protein KF753_19695 [Caldilineaceae bacterium]|nr:hypothetical protein [Caldilineaceae bacterium]